MKRPIDSVLTSEPALGLLDDSPTSAHDVDSPSSVKRAKFDATCAALEAITRRLSFSDNTESDRGDGDSAHAHVLLAHAPPSRCAGPTRSTCGCRSCTVAPNEFLKCGWAAAAARSDEPNRDSCAWSTASKASSAQKADEGTDRVMAEACESPSTSASHSGHRHPPQHGSHCCAGQGHTPPGTSQPHHRDSNNGKCGHSPAAPMPCGGAGAAEQSTLAQQRKRPAAAVVSADESAFKVPFAVPPRDSRGGGPRLVPKESISSEVVAQSPAEKYGHRVPWDRLIGRVYKYMSTVDMLRVASVSRAWRQGSLEHSAWRDVDLSDAHKTVDNDTIKRIVAEHGPHIRSIRLANCWGVTDTGVRAIAEHCPNLTIVSLQSCWEVTDEGVKALAHHIPGLEDINLNNCRKLTDQAVVALTNQCLNLHTLELEYCKNLTAISLQYILARCRLLQTLNLKRCTGLASDAFTAFSTHTAYSLESLVLSDCFGLTDDAVFHIAAGCPALRAINLSFCSGLTQEAMTSLARCPQLVKLDLSSCSNMVTDEAVRAFLYPDFDDVPPHFASVEWMSLRACPKVTDGALVLLNDSCHRLAFLDVMNCRNISDDTIGRCRKIKTIIAGCTIGLTPAKRPKLEPSEHMSATKRV